MSEEERKYSEKVGQRNVANDKVELFSLHRDWMQSLPMKFAMLNIDTDFDLRDFPDWARLIIEKVSAAEFELNFDQVYHFENAPDPKKLSSRD